MVGYNPTIDMSFVKPNTAKIVCICFIIQTVILMFNCPNIDQTQVWVSMLLPMTFCSLFIFLVTSWIYFVIAMIICVIMGWDY